MEVNLRQLYPNDIYKVLLHHDKVTSQTARITKEFLKCLQLITGDDLDSDVFFVDKALDASPKDFFVFGYLKGRLK